MHCNFNCNTVNFDKTQHGTYMIQNFIISIHLIGFKKILLTTHFSSHLPPASQKVILFVLNFKWFISRYHFTFILLKNNVSCFMLLTDWFARKNSRRHGYIYNNIYYWYESGSFNYQQVCSLPIWKCILQARQADRRAI